MEECSIIICNKEKDECCIVCLRHCYLTQMTHIFEKSQKLQIIISDLLELCGGFKIEKYYRFPKGICSKCLQELHIAAAFRDKCQASIEFLMDQVIEGNNSNFVAANDNEKVPENLNQMKDDVKDKIKSEDSRAIGKSNPINNDLFQFYNKDDLNLEKFYDSFDETLYKAKAGFIYQYSCDICGSAFKTVLNLRKHYKKHTSTWFTCIICWHPFTNKVNLKNHFIQRHKGENMSAHIEFADLKSESETSEHFFDETLEKNGNFICKKCNEIFQSREYLKRHLLSHTNTYKCNKCGKLFSSSSKLWQHLKLHNSIRPFGCKYCDMTFKNKSNLNVHVGKHAGLKPHKCALCEKSFSRTNLLKEHLRSHTGEKPFSCEICCKAFSKKRIYVNHKMIHSDNKFCCSFCPQKFVRESQLNFHVKNYHKDLLHSTTIF
ncbi:zinc finger protein OZF-like isoform X2 [Condylostylus longicornis]|uniref:zinc finger protein OZF-like isoform X2 n=1 Tax=Condylostylus longicornis TaxID=2530218 RepID=UPI00244E055B|nr:zinc finger protein OZF-like isoform X2 [Condylostylus longicornis]